MAIRIAINGFGRIGRMFYRAAFTNSQLEIVAVNDITNAATLAHLLKYDSVHGNLPHAVKAEGDQIMVKVLALEGNKIKLSRKAVLKEQRDKLKQQETTK